MDLSKIMQMAEQMRDQMEKAQKEAVNVTADGEAGGFQARRMFGRTDISRAARCAAPQWLISATRRSA